MIMKKNDINILELCDTIWCNKGYFYSSTFKGTIYWRGRTINKIGHPSMKSELEAVLKVLKPEKHLDQMQSQLNYGKIVEWTKKTFSVL